MATETSRSFDEARGAVHVQIQNMCGFTSHHTIYVAGANGVQDVAAHVAQLIVDVDAQASTIRARMVAAGMPVSGAPSK
jgi:hypothetical protein